MKNTLALLALLAGTATLSVVEATGMQHMEAEAPPSYPDPAVAGAIDRAMDWLDAHPAHIAEHELMEVVEEIMFYYALSANAAGNSGQQRYLNEIASRHEAVAASNEDTLERGLHLQGNWAPLTYPPLAHIIASTGLDAGSYRAIIDDLVSRQRHTGLPRKAMQLWIAVYLERLGYTPVPSAERLLERSPLQQDPQSGVLLEHFRDRPASDEDLQATIQLIYNITHEIMALTDFGALQPPAVMMVQHDHYARLIDAAIRWATRETAIDVLAELLFCAHLLDLRGLPSVPAALELILKSQQADGSFGITNPDRANSRRHGVLTCLLALTTVGTDAQGRPSPAS